MLLQVRSILCDWYTHGMCACVEVL